jgi:hypothetical protein
MFGGIPLDNEQILDLNTIQVMAPGIFRLRTACCTLVTSLCLMI